MNESRLKSRNDDPRGWVVRLGSYLRIFGKGVATISGPSGIQPNEGLIRMAQEREHEFGECHICHRPKNGAGEIFCSYPHPAREALGG